MDQGVLRHDFEMNRLRSSNAASILENIKELLAEAHPEGLKETPSCLTEFCKQVIDSNGLEIVRDIMIAFPSSEKVNRQCFKLLKALAGNDHCKTLIIQKNSDRKLPVGRLGISRARNKPQRKVFLDLGVEELLQASLKKFEDIAYDIKAALRDLDCNVQLKEE
ncbi:hypothetical protein NQ318_005936 [Aromia moschata]|uniref:Uncharacterized protein n=1 Tax=Aromia moschata TaxID=1265417 RepID=A0AAV8XKL7_9CUCU|nr:hypothetical protein NQ318_005936 [Aromia moschata]